VVECGVLLFEDLHDSFGRCPRRMAVHTAGKA
jgi:hypothetical protein